MTVGDPIGISVEIVGKTYPVYRLFIMGVSLAVIAFTFWLFFRTQFGLTARGVIANRNMAACLALTLAGWTA